MESHLERHNSAVRSTWCLVKHARAELLVGWHDSWTTTLSLSIVDHAHLVSSLDRASSAHGGSESFHSFWRHIEEGLLVNLVKLLWWVEAHASPSSDDLLHDVSLGSFKQSWMIVSQRDLGDVCENIQVHIAIRVRNVISH